ncbi:hypothetical protein GIB67_028190 [Kingdonia uniflora]|uniref:Vitamin K epoxide reductase domain-containing protein n=1 Tax=Kingdonia uniflora TaxID=39325 RepID=A0A7J7KZ41_9MAGN|nr:hypothetical protein GIB67_028190 [Kingdonia uniflora]
MVVALSMASFVRISTPSLFSLPRRLSTPLFPPTHFKRMVIYPLKCLPGPTQSGEEEPQMSTLSHSDILTYRLCAGLGAIGFLETGYLSYLKITNSDVLCPISGGSCSDILNSDYALVFGIPLPLIGMVTYGLVAFLGLNLSAKDLPFGLDESNGRAILLGATTSIAAASGYFLYLLSTKFAGASCAYCLLSAALSFTLFFTTLKNYGLQEIRNVVGLQLCIAGLVVTALNTSYNNSPISFSLADINLPYYGTEITTQSSPLALSLAKHLHAVGAKMYGAFWCSHCLEQKQMFGREATEILDYVECFPGGFRKGTKIAIECAFAGIEGFPTWVINGQVISGEKDFSELASASGFVLENLNPS